MPKPEDQATVRVGQHRGVAARCAVASEGWTPLRLPAAGRSQPSTSKRDADRMGQIHADARPYGTGCQFHPAEGSLYGI